MLFALASFSLTGCTNDPAEYEPGTDKAGAQAYFAATTAAFSVSTAAEKEEASKETAALVNRISTRANFEDDKEVSIYLSRKSKSAAQTVNVNVTFSASNDGLFTFAGAGAGQTSADGKSVIYTVPLNFEAQAETAALTVGFDINELQDNTAYSFTAALADDADGTYYGASNCTFSLTHTTEVAGLPFVNIGSATIDYEWYWELDPHSVIVQLHKDDLNAWMAKNNVTSFKEYGTNREIKFDAAGAKEYRKTAAGEEYLRVFIPKFMYQIVAAAEAEETEDVLDLGFESYDEAYEYFEECDGLLVNMSTSYEQIGDYSNGYEKHPLTEEKLIDVLGMSASYKFVLPYMTGINDLGNPHGSFYIVDSAAGLLTSSFHIGAYYSNGSPIDVFFSFGTSTASQSTNHYVYTPYYYVSGLGGWGAQELSFTWDENSLEDDWDNYFSVDYNKDLQLAYVGTGLLTSQYYGNVPEESDDEENEANVEKIYRGLYKGYNDILKKTAYYMAGAYADGYGLAVEFDGSAAKVANNQPLGITLFGKEMYASQSSTYSSKVEFASNGAVSSITFGVNFHDADGHSYLDFSEVLNLEKSTGSINDFIGTFAHVAYEVGGTYIDGPALYALESTVTITKASGNKVTIDGLMDEWYLSAYGFEGGSLEGTYDADANCVIIPAQFFNKPVWADPYGEVDEVFPYFQPCTTDYNVFGSTIEDAFYLSLPGDYAPAAALYLDGDGSLYMTSSPTDGSGLFVDGYAIMMYYYDDGAFEEYDWLYATFSNGGYYLPSFYPMGAASYSSLSKSNKAAAQKLATKPLSGKTHRIAVKR